MVILKSHQIIIDQVRLPEVCLHCMCTTKPLLIYDSRNWTSAPWPLCLRVGVFLVGGPWPWTMQRHQVQLPQDCRIM